MKTKQSAGARQGYVKAKHTAEGKRVSQMKKDAYGKAATVNRLQKGGVKDKAMALYLGVKNAGQGKRANEAERKHQRMARVRFGDKKK